MDLDRANAAGVDDVLDAAVGAWSARRIAAGEAICLPKHTRQRMRAGGRWIAIWA